MNPYPSHCHWVDGGSAVTPLSESAGLVTHRTLSSEFCSSSWTSWLRRGVAPAARS